MPYVYHIHFELEQIVEEGGYMKEGVVVSRDGMGRRVMSN